MKEGENYFDLTTLRSVPRCALLSSVAVLSASTHQHGSAGAFKIIIGIGFHGKLFIEK